MFQPLSFYGAREGTKVGIIGLGGLGQMGVRIAKALGCVVTVISRAQSKEAFAKTCGADKFITSENQQHMRDNSNDLDLILNTIPTYHNYMVGNPFFILIT